jgi:hypothetical protein
MELENIIEICVAIDIAILGIAYPIIVDKISNIGDKYSSLYLSELFNQEFPQKTITINFRKRQLNFSIFKSTLYLTILTFVFLIFKFKPLFGWNNWMVNNSAKLLVLFGTSILTIFFFIWLDKLVLFNGKSTTLLKRIISKYGNLRTDSQFKAYHLKSINELTFYAINKQDEHLQQTLLEFYAREFWKIRKNQDKSQPLVYPVDLYFFVNKLNVELINSQNNKLSAIEHRAVSASWLLGQEFDHVVISEETYNWIWRNLYTICDKDKFVRMYWANVSQYFEYRFQHTRQDMNFETGVIINKEEVEKRENERKRFLELHYAFGGLLLYRKKYTTIKYIFDYTQSQPPSYPLLPFSMTEIFIWFEHFRNEFKTVGLPIDTKYDFPELDNLGNRLQVTYWICSYLCLLFIRQFSLHTYYVFQNHTSQPKLPDEVIELNNWLDSISFFKRCLDSVLINQQLISDLQLTQTVNDNKDQFNAYTQTLKESIIAKIGSQKLQAPLSEDKITNFKNTTKRIITSAFETYKNVVTPSFEERKNSDLKNAITGGVMLMTKSGFTNDEVEHLNYNSFFAEQVAENSIQRFIPNSFLAAATRRYLLNKENLLNGLDKLIEDEEVMIIGINLGYELEQQINNSRHQKALRLIPSTQYHFQDVLFVLHKKDLPVIEHKDLTQEEKEKFRLSLLDDNLKLYASIIDINTPEYNNLKNEWLDKNDIESEDLKVLVSIAFLSLLYWNNDRDIVQINLASDYAEQGIQNSINEIEPLKRR